MNTPNVSLSSGIAWMWMGRVSSRLACRMILFAFCKLSMVGFDVSLADNETFAAKSILEFVANHWSEPFIHRNDVIPIESSLFFPLILYKFLGRLNSVVESFCVNSCWSICTEKSLFCRYRTPQRVNVSTSHFPHLYKPLSFAFALPVGFLGGLRRCQVWRCTASDFG